MTEKFWKVLPIEKHEVSSLRFLSERSAITYAERMSTLHGGRFMVLEAIAIVENVGVQVTMLTDGAGQDKANPEAVDK